MDEKLSHENMLKHVEMQSKNPRRYHCTPFRMAKIKRLIIPTVHEDIKQTNPSYTGGNTKLYSHFGKYFVNLLIKLYKNKLQVN